MKQKQSGRKFKILFVLLGVLVLGFILNYVIAVTVLPSRETIEYDWNAGEGGGSVYLTMNVSKQWDEPGLFTGAEYDFVLHNSSNNTITDWTVDIPLTGEVKPIIDSNIWNVSFTQEDHMLHLTALPDTTEVEAGDNQTFGMVMVSEEIWSPVPVTFSYMKEYNPIQLPSFIILVLLAFAWAMFLVQALSEQNEKTKAARQEEQNRLIILQSMGTFVNFIDAKDPYTKGHSQRVATVAAELARRMELGEKIVNHVYYAGLLHDAGKISVPDSILKKVGILTPEEYKVMQQHPVTGGQMLKEFTSISGIREGALYHHERFDGHGYPEGLSGMDIPLFGRIICVADAYDAMARDRCYRKHLDKEKILAEFTEHSGKQFDPHIAGIMIDMVISGEAEELIKAL